MEEGRKCVPGSAKTICAKTQRQVSRPVRGQREKREGGEEGTGGWARPPQRWVCTLRSPALGRATGRSSTQGVVVKCDAFHPPFSQQHTHGIWNGCLPCAGQWVRGRRPCPLGQCWGPRELRRRRARRRHVSSFRSPTSGA